MKKENYFAIDYMKMICAILVICVHSAPLISFSEEANFFLTQVLGRIAVPFFFISSAFFFFRKLDYTIELKNQFNLNLLKKYLVKIFKLYLVWTIIYFFITLISWIRTGFTLDKVWMFIQSFFFSGSYYHLWFLPSLMVSILIVYFLIQKFSKGEIFLIAFAFYLIGSLVNVYGIYLSTLPVVKDIIEIYLKIFLTTRNGLFFGFIYVFMGYTLTRVRIKKNTKIIIPCLICFILYCGEVYLVEWLGFYDSLICMYIMLIPFIYTLVILLLQFHSKVSTSIIREMSLLVYVSHLLFIECFNFLNINEINSFLYFLLIVVSSILFSYFVIKEKEKFKFLKVLG